MTKNVIIGMKKKKILGIRRFFHSHRRLLIKADINLTLYLQTHYLKNLLIPNFFTSRSIIICSEATFYNIKEYSSRPSIKMKYIIHTIWRNNSWNIFNCLIGHQINSQIRPGIDDNLECSLKVYLGAHP